MCSGSNTKFEINDYMIYGGNGVCILKDICVPDIHGIDTTKKYYMLQPLYSKASIIYSPVDNSKTVMRKVITKEEAQKLIENIPSIELFWVEDEKKREEQYNEALNTYNCYELVRIIKTLYLRKEERVQQKKPVAMIDERYLRMAEDLLYGELAIPLELPKEQVESYIIEQVRQLYMLD